MSISQRLRELDRKVLREERLATPDGWAREMARWRRVYSSAVVLCTASVLNSVFAVAAGQVPLVVASGGMAGTSVALALRAGQMRAEHDRIIGRPHALRPRRPGG